MKQKAGRKTVFQQLTGKKRSKKTGRKNCQTAGRKNGAKTDRKLSKIDQKKHRKKNCKKLPKMTESKHEMIVKRLNNGKARKKVESKSSVRKLVN